MKLTAKIYSCYELTYKKVFGDIASRLYPGKSEKDFILKIDHRPDNGKRTIQGQRSLDEYATRTIRFYEGRKLAHIVALSNTNYDYDKQHEKDLDPTKKYKFGKSNYHANTYLLQGIANIFNYYYKEKKRYPTIDLSFYLLDVDKNLLGLRKNPTYTHNLFNILSYRELYTIGFKILNIDKVNFAEYEEKTHSNLGYVSCNSDISFQSFSKFFNQIKIVSEQKKDNNYSILREEEIQKLDQYGNAHLVERYTYYFKSLSAQGYDSFIRLWCMKVLAGKENRDINFVLGKQYFDYDAEEPRIADDLTKPIKKALKNAGIKLNYLTDNQFMKDRKNSDKAYQKAKQDNDPRNQKRFSEALINSNQPRRCLMCGDEDPTHLDAAHIWEVHSISRANRERIEFAMEQERLSSLLDQTSEHNTDLFYKKYTLANTAYNGFWLCKTCHRDFDNNAFYFYVDEDEKLCVCKDGTREIVDYYIGNVPQETISFIKERNHDMNNI